MLWERYNALKQPSLYMQVVACWASFQCVSECGAVQVLGSCAYAVVRLSIPVHFVLTELEALELKEEFARRLGEQQRTIEILKVCCYAARNLLQALGGVRCVDESGKKIMIMCCRLQAHQSSDTGTPAVCVSIMLSSGMLYYVSRPSRCMWHAFSDQHLCHKQDELLPQARQEPYWQYFIVAAACRTPTRSCSLGSGMQQLAAQPQRHNWLPCRSPLQSNSKQLIVASAQAGANAHSWPALGAPEASCVCVNRAEPACRPAAV